MLTAPKHFGALREAAIYTAFFQNVGNKMQLSEGAPSGETGDDSDDDGIPFIPEQADGLPPIFASKAIFDLK